MRFRALSAIVLSLLIIFTSGPSAIIGEADLRASEVGFGSLDDVAVYDGAEIALSERGEFEILVTYADDSTRLEKISLYKKYGISDIEEVTEDDIFLIRVKGESIDNIMASFEQEPVLELAQPNYVYDLPEMPVMSVEQTIDSLEAGLLADSGVLADILDPYYGLQWGLKNTGQSGGNPGFDIDAESAWATTTGSSEIIVAVMDSGVDITHPDLVGSLWTNPDEIANDGIDNDNNGYEDDVHGWDFYNDYAVGDEDYMPNFHGTHVAGIIAAQHNSIGVRGVAPDIKIMPINFFGYSSTSSDTDGSTNTAEIVEAMQYAQNEGARIMNASWGTYSFDQVMYDAMAASSMLFVAAAGNDGVNVETSRLANYPAAFDLPNLISIGAINNTGSLAYFSNYGVNRVHIVSPGREIYSTHTVESRYGYESGTSMAAPHVSGIAALLLSVYPDLTANDLKNIIISSNEPLRSLDKTIFSAGMADAKKALVLAALHGTADYYHQVIFRSWDNEILKKENITAGGTASAPTAPVRSGYTFAGWSGDATNIQQPMSIQALYTINPYTVIFQDWDGREIKRETVNHGSSATAPASPTRTGYTFAGWDRAYTNVTSNITVKATYSINSYDVVFKNWDGSVIKSERVSYGGSATAPADPVRTDYTFAGWDSSFQSITANKSITALFEQYKLLSISSSPISYDAGGQFLYGFSVGSTIDSLLANFSNPAEHLRFLAADGTVITDSSRKLATGMVVQLFNSDLRDQKNIIIRGDIDGDGQISALDLLQTKQYLLGKNSLKPASYEAARINNQQNVSALDLLQLKKHLLKQIEIR